MGKISSKLQTSENSRDKIENLMIIVVDRVPPSRTETRQMAGKDIGLPNNSNKQCNQVIFRIVQLLPVGRIIEKNREQIAKN